MNRIFVGLCALGLLLAGLSAQAQDKDTSKGIPTDVYYLMPKFGQGYIFFRGQAPAQGKVNICAVDNTLRFIDNSGQELEVSNAEDVVKVQVDTVAFLHHQNIYYRLSPVAPDLGIAIHRYVKVYTDEKQSGYGGSSQTSSIQSYSTLYAEGMIYELEAGKTYPYEVTETLFLYKGQTVVPFTKKNLRKLFPSKKAEVDAYFAAGGSVPETLPEARALLRSFAE